MQYEIRAYRPSDLTPCRSLWVELTERHREIYKDPHIGGDQPGLQFDEHLATVGPENLWVAVGDEGVVGLTGLIWSEKACEVEPVVVRSSHRRRGIGRRLVQVVIDAAHERGARQLSVRPVARNEDAMVFFRELGFDVLGHVELFMDFRPGDRQRWHTAPPSTTDGFRY